MSYMLKMVDIVKSFPGVIAVNHVDLDVKKGEVLALVGENGAGKSTLMKVLSGVNTPNQGTVEIDGSRIEKFDPIVAIQKGVAMIYQELNNIESVSIAENIFIGRVPVKGPLKTVDYKALRKETKELLDQVGIERDPFEKIANISIAERQLIEIAKAISQNAKVIVFDEPTSALNETEAENLFYLIQKLTDEGRAVIYITHKMDEVYAVADRVMVMRDGCRVGCSKVDEISKDEIIKLMVGREIKDMYPIYHNHIGETILEVNHLIANGVNDVSFHIKKGEVLGVFGLMGAGQTEIMEAVYGARPKKSGTILINGKEAKINQPWDAQKYGIMYLPPERKTESILPNMSVRQNMTISSLESVKRNGMIKMKLEQEVVEKWVEKFNIKTTSIDKAITGLSGGNQQKVLLAKSLMNNPEVVIINEPTRGVDVGAKAEIYALLNEMCQAGMAIIAVCSEIEEVMAISNRTICIHDGKITGELSKEEYSQVRVLKYAIGEAD